jgi:hypothetical protein
MNVIKRFRLIRFLNPRFLLSQRRDFLRSSRSGDLWFFSSLLGEVGEKFVGA